MASVDPRVEAGLATLARLRADRLASGESHVGWKIGFGSPSGLELLGLDAPIIGFLTDTGDRPVGEVVDITGWAGPVVECEVAVWIGSTITPGTSPAEIAQHVIGFAPAFEYADVDIPPRDVEIILGGNIFHRGYALGPRFDSSIEEVSGLTATVVVDDVVTRVESLTALTGGLADVIARAAELAPRVGREIQPGDVILTGSIMPPAPVRQGSVVEYRLGDVPPIAASFA